MGSNVSEILGPLAADTMRVVFLYVGQGESTLLMVPHEGGGHLSVLVDCNRAVDLKGIDVAALLEDFLPKGSNGKPRLDYFVNTHPHKDHLCGLAEIREAIEITNVWHSGHKPGKDHDGPYQELKKLIAAVTDSDDGEAIEMTGSRSSIQLGKACVHILSPAQHVTDDIDGEDGGARYQRIHEQCAVVRVGYGPAYRPVRVLLTGDSDKLAWQEHIAYHHRKGEENRVASDILSASHHGSRTFFKTAEDDEEPYTAHLDAIAPTYLIISAPSQAESCHGHPHDDALKLYKAVVKQENILHMGSSKQSFILDIPADGEFTIRSDRGELAKAYGLGGSGGKGGGSTSTGSVWISRVERTHPMGRLP